jgi:hypothetical protein
MSRRPRDPAVEAACHVILLTGKLGYRLPDLWLGDDNEPKALAVAGGRRAQTGVNDPVESVGRHRIGGVVSDHTPLADQIVEVHTPILSPPNAIMFQKQIGDMSR